MVKQGGLRTIKIISIIAIFWHLSRDKDAGVGRRIAWRLVGGESDNAGEVVFEPSPGGRATMVTVLQEFRMGKLTSLCESIIGRNPKQAVIENLRHFKALAETGEIPRTQGQPHGPRGRIAGMKESAYGEKITTPPGLNRKAS